MTASVPSDATFNSREFRNALGRFATGITIVTALGPDGKPIGVTISSFNSVSLDPPLILWSLATELAQAGSVSSGRPLCDQRARCRPAGTVEPFCLAQRQGRFADVPVPGGLDGLPLIDGCCAWFECAPEAHYPGGDHLIFLGRVERFARSDATSPLVFFDGAYCWLDMDEAD